MAPGNHDGDIIGLNFGGKWTDNTGSTENAVFVNGAITKISRDVEFLYDRNDFMKPWKYCQLQKDVQLSFIPFFERTAISDVLVVKSEVHQMVGHYYGKNFQ